MPELPEVETIRCDLEPRLVGRTLVGVRIHAGAERLAVTHAPREIEAELAGRRVESLARHGKYLVATLDDDRAWVLHLRMSGWLRHGTVDAEPHRFERARVDLDDGTTLRLNDLRKFATWHLVADPREAMPHTGPDALSERFDARVLGAALRRRTTSVKAVLLDQRVAAGVGNIYADEACWVARIDPRTEAARVGPRRAVRLHAAVRQVLLDSISHRGSSFQDYRDALGAEGLHMVRVHVFRRDGEPCRRCGRTIVKVRVAGRGTHLCPGCQRR